MTVGTARRTERPEGLDASTVAEAFQLTAAAHPDRPALRLKDDSVSLTWAEYADKVRRVAAGLAGLGLERGASMGIMLTNRPEFHWFDAAALHLGATPFSIYNTYAAEQVQYQLGDAEARILVTEKAFLDRVQGLAGVEHVIVVDDEDGIDAESHAADGFDFDAAWRAVEPDDVLTLIYTSGTTGPPKGVELTHSNLIAAVNGFDEVIAFPGDGRVVSWLPMAHIAERACSHYLPMLLGFTTTDCPDPRQVVAYLPEVRPTWFFAVPRIWEKLKAAIEAGVAAEQDDAKRQATEWALGVGLRKVRLEQAGEPVPDELRAEHAKADELVLSKMRARLGLDSVESVNVGAAPTPREVIEFFHAIGVPLAELWGMSETTGYGTCNPPERIKIGTVGPVSPGVEMKLAEDGEVLIRGPVVTRGYRNQPEQTREAIDADGWLHTGDVGEFDEDGYLSIVDRKKELIISAGGKNMSPANIEARVKAASPVIGQVIAIGDGRPYNVALITLDPDVAPAFAKQHGEEAVLAEVERGVAAANDQMARVEEVKRYKVLDAEWQPGGEELTPTMKLKRKPINAKYAKEIEELYS
ncbi:MAG: long-chain acyl-CoA synthetase [Thermoleophilaceae bacterium]|jgi:long-subunit acyl-CoA synthetase (AMP-forming)|nr:long-chain acyl-CoA synthetase [Thermoleophilaceae bacterium]